MINNLSIEVEKIFVEEDPSGKAEEDLWEKVSLIHRTKSIGICTRPLEVGEDSEVEEEEEEEEEDEED
jgi:hypothetical protein